MAEASGSTAPDRLNVDWDEIERSPEFRELVSKRRSFVLPATVFFLVWYMVFILLASYATEFMGERIYQGLTVGYCLALTQFVMVAALGIMYLRRSANTYDPLAAAAVERYAREHDLEVKDAAEVKAGDGRFERKPSGPAAPKTPGVAR